MTGLIVAGILAVGGYALYQHARKGRDAGPEAPPESLPAPQGGGGGAGTQDGQVFTAKIPQGNFVLTARERVPFDVQFRPVDKLKRPADTSIGWSTGRSIGWKGYRMQEFTRAPAFTEPHGTFYLAEENVKDGGRPRAQADTAAADRAIKASRAAYAALIPGIGPLIAAYILSGTGLDETQLARFTGLAVAAPTAKEQLRKCWNWPPK
jgi:hypothetical protein